MTLAILSSIAFTALALTGAAALRAEKEVKANALQSQSYEHTETLLFPASYEEYLPLTSPSDVAVTDGYHAVSDGNAIHVYNAHDGVYRTYFHEQNVEAAKNVVTKLQFYGNSLYFLDASTGLYVLDVRTLGVGGTPTQTGLSCSTFAIHKDSLYFTTISNGISQLSKAPLNDLKMSSSITLLDNLSLEPTLAFFGGELYYTDAGVYLNKIDPETKGAQPTFLSKFSANILSMYISGNVLTCSDINGNFYAYDLAQLSVSPNANLLDPIFFAAGDHAALTAHGGFVYVIQNTSVRQYDLEQAAFTEYEISSSSTSINRLNGGTESCLANNKLFIADDGNDRIGVYDVTANEFLTPISSDLTASYLASDGETVLASDSSQAVLYSAAGDSYGEILATFAGFNGNVVGTASVYGKYYFLTDNNYFYVTDEADNWNLTETKKISTRFAKLLTSDAYGNLYVGTEKSVYRYTEAEFLSPTHEGEELFTDLPVNTTKLLIDYTGGAYALADGKLQKLGGEPYELNAPLVYSDSATIASFAFSLEENATYLLYEENYVVKTDALDLPTFKTIAVGDAAEKIFASESATFSVVQTQENALVIAFAMENLQGAEYFPYLSFYRTKAPFTALKIGETETHFVLAAYDETAKTYTTCLVLQSQCSQYSDDEYRIPYEQAKTGYLTNEVSLYKFPYLNSDLTVLKLASNSKVDIVGEIDKLDHAYYEIVYTDGENRYTGFVPKVYVSEFNGTPTPPTHTILGSTNDNSDGIWRLVYLLLGAGAICILLDYLILKKRDKDE